MVTLCSEVRLGPTQDWTQDAEWGEWRVDVLVYDHVNFPVEEGVGNESSRGLRASATKLAAVCATFCLDLACRPVGYMYRTRRCGASRRSALRVWSFPRFRWNEY